MLLQIERDLKVQELYSSGKLFNMAVRRAVEKYHNEELRTDWKPSWPVAVKAKVCYCNTMNYGVVCVCVFLPRSKPFISYRLVPF